jgi:hypothetical protein
LEINGSGTTFSIGSGATKLAVAYSDFSGSLSSSIVAVKKTSMRTALQSRLLYLPALELLILDHDPKYVVSTAGQEQLRGRSVEIINIADRTLSAGSGAPPVALLRLYVDPVSFQILERDDTIYDDNDTPYNRSITYGDYRLTGKFSAPFRLTESMAGQTLNTTQWNSISLNF